MNRRYLLVTWFISVSLLIAGMSCSPVAVFLDSAATDSEPQSGEWSGSLSYPTSGGQDVTWNLGFIVAEGRRQVIELTVMRYVGELGPDNWHWMRDPHSHDIEGNSFSIPLREITPYTYTAYTHVFEGTFTSSSEVVGTLTTAGETYEWTANPVEP